MSSRADSEAKEDISQESYELLTSQDQESSGEAAGIEETQASSSTSPEELQRRLKELQRIRQGLDVGTQVDPTTRATELIFVQGHRAPLQSDSTNSQSQDGQGANL